MKDHPKRSVPRRIGRLMPPIVFVPPNASSILADAVFGDQGMATREEIVWLYRCLLYRDPESEEVINFYVSSPYSFEDLRNIIAASEEVELRRQKSLIEKEVTFFPNDPIPSMVAPKLAFVAIVKNGAASVRRMLASVLNICDFIVVLDTGSQDGTAEVAQNFLEGSQVPFGIACKPFIDFSTTRNAAIEMVPSDCHWILTLDADEYIVASDHAAVISLLQQANFQGWQLPRYNFSYGRGLYQYPDYQRRIFRNSPNIRYSGKVHEHIVGVPRWGFAQPNLTAQNGTIGGPHIHHTGLLDRNADAIIAKNTHYIGLTSKDVRLQLSMSKVI